MRSLITTVNPKKIADSPYRRVGESAIEFLKEVRVQVVPEEPEK
jgi:hypothetical protein